MYQHFKNRTRFRTQASLTQMSQLRFRKRLSLQLPNKQLQHEEEEEVEEMGHTQNECSFINLPEGLLGHILSMTSVDDVIRCASVCKDLKSYIGSKYFKKEWGESRQLQGPPWLFAFRRFDFRGDCSAYNPLTDKWFSISLPILPHLLQVFYRPVAAVGGLLLTENSLVWERFAVCNLITKQWRRLPPLHRRRSTRSSIMCMIERGFHSADQSNICKGFQIIVAGGRSPDGKQYEPTIEVYDSCTDSWRVVGEIPCKYAAKLAELRDTVYCNGLIYCLACSAGDYSIIAFDFLNDVWSEIMVPKQLFFCPFSFVRGRSRLTFVERKILGVALNDKLVSVWELHEERWLEIASFSHDLFDDFFGVKFAGSGDFLYFKTESGSRMLVCRLSSKNHQETWRWVPCCSSLILQRPDFFSYSFFIRPGLDVLVFD